MAGTIDSGYREWKAKREQPKQPNKTYKSPGGWEFGYDKNSFRNFADAQAYEDLKKNPIYTASQFMNPGGEYKPTESDFINQSDAVVFGMQQPYRSPTTKYTVDKAKMNALIRGGMNPKNALYKSVISSNPYGVDKQWENFSNALSGQLQFNDEPIKNQGQVVNRSVGDYGSAVRGIMENEPDYINIAANQLRDQVAAGGLGVRDIARGTGQAANQIAQQEAKRGLMRIENAAQKSSRLGDMVLQEKADTVKILNQEIRALMARGDTEAAVFAAGLREKEQIRAQNIFNDQLKRKIKLLADAKRTGDAKLAGDTANAITQSIIGLASIYSPQLMALQKPVGEGVDVLVTDSMD